MSLLRRFLAIALAAAMTAGPTLACADFCPQSGSIIEQGGSSEPNLQIAMPEDCADAVNAPANTPPLSHDPNCLGCSDCPAIASAKNPAIAYAGAISIELPSMIRVDLEITPVTNLVMLARHRLTPPANGPPVKATPVILKDILRL